MSTHINNTGVPEQRVMSVQLDEMCHEQIHPGRDGDVECRLNILQQWICELLIKNQQLRMSLESAINMQNQGMNR